MSIRFLGAVLASVLLVSFSGSPIVHADEEPAPLIVRVRPRATSSTVSSEKGAPCPPPTAPLPPGGKAMSDERTEMLSGIAEKAEHFSMDDVYPLLGHCEDPDGKADLATRKIIPELKRVFKRPQDYLGRQKREADYTEEMPKIRKDNGKIAIEADWIAVDLLARTLYSEVGSNAKCGDEYVKAVGKLIMNRMDAAAKSEAARTNFLKGKEVPGAHPIVPVVLAPRQFAVWGAQNNANKWAACPAKERQQHYKYRDKKGNQMSSGQKANDNWQRSMEVASEIIFRENHFRRDMASFSALHYTTSEAEAKIKLAQCYKPARNSIQGKSINRADCMQPWIEPTPEEIKNCSK